MATAYFPGMVALVPVAVPMEVFMTSSMASVEELPFDGALPPPSPTADGAVEARRSRNEGKQAPMRQCAEVFKKTSVCRYYPRCHKGDSCRFAHATGELRIRPNLAKTRMCAGFFDGRCKLSSDECNFAHGEHELRQREVPYFGVWTGQKEYEASRAAAAGEKLAKGSRQRLSSRLSCGALCDGSGRSTPVAEAATAAGSSRAQSTSSGASTPSMRSLPGVGASGEADGVAASVATMSPARSGDIEDTITDGLASPVSSEEASPAAASEQPETFFGEVNSMDSVMAKWLQDIVALNNNSKEPKHLPTPDECTAALMKAMPEYYED